jgi:hypothetical protein
MFRLVDVDSHIIKDNSITDRKEIRDPIDEITFHIENASG